MSSLLIIDATIAVASAIIAETGLSYFGFGVQPPDWIAYGPIPIVIFLSLHYYVYSYLSVSSSITSVDSQLEEAGAMAGLSRLKQFLWITAPLLLPGSWRGEAGGR